MENTPGHPFWDRAREVSGNMTYTGMAEGSLNARSHNWWRQLVESGPSKVSPPGPETLDGIAALFGVAPERVAEMVAEDWFGVRVSGESDRVLNTRHLIDSLDEGDAVVLEGVLRRLAIG